MDTEDVVRDWVNLMAAQRLVAQSRIREAEERLSDAQLDLQSAEQAVSRASRDVERARESMARMERMAVSMKSMDYEMFIRQTRRPR